MTPFITVDEAAELLGLNPETVRYLARNKRIPAGKLGRVWRFSRSDLESFLRDQYGEVKAIREEMGLA